eukprot:g4131.t1
MHEKLYEPPRLATGAVEEFLEHQRQGTSNDGTYYPGDCEAFKCIDHSHFHYYETCDEASHTSNASTTDQNLSAYQYFIIEVFRFDGDHALGMSTLQKLLTLNIFRYCRAGYGATRLVQWVAIVRVLCNSKSNMPPESKQMVKILLLGWFVEISLVALSLVIGYDLSTLNFVDGYSGGLTVVLFLLALIIEPCMTKCFVTMATRRAQKLHGDKEKYHTVTHLDIYKTLMGKLKKLKSNHSKNREIDVTINKKALIPWLPVPYSEHLVERYGILMIIVQGESLMHLLIANSESFESNQVMNIDHWKARSLVTPLSILVIFIQWWIYFDSADENIFNGLHKFTAFMFRASHYFLLMGLPALASAFSMLLNIRMCGNDSDTGKLYRVPQPLLCFFCCAFFLVTLSGSWPRFQAIRRRMVESKKFNRSTHILSMIVWSTIIFVVLLAYPIFMAGYTEDAAFTQLNHRHLAGGSNTTSTSNPSSKSKALRKSVTQGGWTVSGIVIYMAAVSLILVIIDVYYGVRVEKKKPKHHKKIFQKHARVITNTRNPLVASYQRHHHDSPDTETKESPHRRHRHRHHHHHHHHHDSSDSSDENNDRLKTAQAQMVAATEVAIGSATNEEELKQAQQIASATEVVVAAAEEVIKSTNRRSSVVPMKSNQELLARKVAEQQAALQKTLDEQASLERYTQQQQERAQAAQPAVSVLLHGGQAQSAIQAAPQQQQTPQQAINQAQVQAAPAQAAPAQAAPAQAAPSVSVHVQGAQAQAPQQPIALQQAASAQPALQAVPQQQQTPQQAINQAQVQAAPAQAAPAQAAPAQAAPSVSVHVQGAQAQAPQQPTALQQQQTPQQATNQAQVQAAPAQAAPTISVHVGASAQPALQAAPQQPVAQPVGLKKAESSVLSLKSSGKDAATRAAAAHKRRADSAAALEPPGLLEPMPAESPVQTDAQSRIAYIRAQLTANTGYDYSKGKK